jgi:hypothetical protein
MNAIVKFLAITGILGLAACKSDESAKDANSRMLAAGVNPADFYLLSKKIYDTARLPNQNSGSRDYLTMNIDFNHVKPVFEMARESLGLDLKNRGEAHITLITPPEYAVLKRKLSRQDILAAINNDSLQDATFEAKCLGKGVVHDMGGDKSTVYLVVSSPDLVERRRALRNQFESSGGRAGDFDADRFFSHITVGFTERDLHESDGVIKNTDSCVAPVKFVP